MQLKAAQARERKAAIELESNEIKVLEHQREMAEAKELAEPLENPVDKPPELRKSKHKWLKPKNFLKFRDKKAGPSTSVLQSKVQQMKEETKFIESQLMLESRQAKLDHEVHEFGTKAYEAKVIQDLMKTKK